MSVILWFNYLHVIICTLKLFLLHFFPCACSSYLHCRWADIEELEKDKRIHQKVKRFKAKQALNNFISEVSTAIHVNNVNVV